MSKKSKGTPTGAVETIPEFHRDIASRLSSRTKRLLRDYTGGSDSLLQQSLLDDLNRIMGTEAFEDASFKELMVAAGIDESAYHEKTAASEKLIRNRLLLLAAFPAALSGEVTRWEVTLHGRNFAPKSIVYVDGSETQDSHFIDPKTLSFKVTAKASDGPISVAVQTPDTETRVSDAIDIEFEEPPDFALPAATNRTETTAQPAETKSSGIPHIENGTIQTVANPDAGAPPQLKLKLTGTGFTNECRVVVDGADVPKESTSVENPTSICATIIKPAGDAKTVKIAVRNQAPDGGTSNEITVSCS